MAVLKSILIVFIVFCFIQTIQLCWSVDESTLHCSLNERNALFDFKQSLIDQSNRLSSWVGHDCCKWEGVSCNNVTGHVVKLDLRNPFPFDGKTYSKACLKPVSEVSPSLLELKHLSHLDLSGNNFSGIIIPKFFGLFPELTYLNLSNAWFGGIVPHHLGNLSALHSLDLGTKEMLSYYGNVPSLVVNTLHWTSSLFSLRILDMSGIDLSNIPHDSYQAIASFPSLWELYFSFCLLEINPIHHSSLLGNLTSLTILDLSQNNFKGPIPSAIRNMTSLKVLQLEENYFEGEIPAFFGELQSLKELTLGNNCLTGRIPTSLTKLSALEILNLRGNLLTGQIPTLLGRMSALIELDLSANQLSGDLPVSLGKLSKLRGLKLYFNQFTGSIPKSFRQLSQLTYIDLHVNQLSGDIFVSLGNLSNLITLYLGSNQFNGVVTELHFARLAKLKNLGLNNNSLFFNIKSGWVPPFQLHSIDLGSCQGLGPQFPDWLQTQTGLEKLFIYFSGISDSIPNWFQNLTSLDTLDVTGNQIYGKVPSFTKYIVYLFLSSNRFEGSLPLFSSSLEVLNLFNNNISGPIPTDFGHTFPHLVVLDLSNNNINGTIPKSFCKLLSLYLLDISKNNLSGNLPHCLGDFQNMVVMDLTSNNLSGTIQRPFCPSSFALLRSLHLSKNNFHGDIFASLKNCTELSILDVSDNKLSGEIPTWIGKTLHSLRILKLSSNKYNGVLSPMLCHLNELQILDVSGNNLSGNIPYCFGNMLFNQTGEPGGISFVILQIEMLSQVIKGREYEYTKTLRFLSNLDLSNNNFIGKIPEQLTKISRLVSLNLSQNRLTGRIPLEIGQMRSLESLDLSNNHLSGTIPQSVAAITYLSYLNLSNNNLSGPIPSTNQFHTFNDPSIYSGNSELCGLPLERKCTYVNGKEKGKEDGDGDGNEDGFITMSFYIGMVCGCVVGFWCFCGVLLFKKSWRYVYFQYVNDIVDRLCYYL